jgi:hypothetical protein
MVLKLDPAISLVWRNPTSLQFGLEPPLAVLPAVSNAQERMVAALAVGISSTGLEMVARSANAAAGEREALLASLAPALLPHNDADAARLDTHGRASPWSAAASRLRSLPACLPEPE